MSAKLIIHKFESGLNYKSLQINIGEDDNDPSETKFSEWFDGKSFQKKKENEKLPRLVVKVVSGNEISNFNLDSCAKVVSNLDMSPHQNSSHNLENAIMIYNNINENIHNDFEQSQINNGFYTCGNIEHEPYLDLFSPLEYSLEKVKENNARIMENIQMLNMTLKYTKKKETLDTDCATPIQSFPCKTCGKCFVYETGLKRHHAIRHSILESQPRWQVVWTCIECFQVWPQYELALKHSTQCCSSDSTDCVREIKTSSVLQCEFCEKVFTSIPRLLRHAKMHTTDNNYECNACNIIFESYKSAEDHWVLCPWLKSCYSFSLPKLLLCNACDRKFRNYEQLYNHRYKIGHFMAKNNNSSLGTYIYQCELCGHCSSTTSLLQLHKKQSHPFHGPMSYNVVKNNNEFQNNYLIANENDDDYINKQN